ncbi:hypothetical protein ACMAZF_01265 [Psychrobium sp. nBUS_13]|uniref:hypothetical protein n=1 Tax=Psychrobium sp. nBUS_13 TaxID=3395319 RepID=UPI003EB89EC1
MRGLLTIRKTRTQQLKEVATFAAALVLFYLAGYYSSQNGEFNNFLRMCNDSGEVHHVVNGETLHVKCEQVKMKLEWVTND